MKMHIKAPLDARGLDQDKPTRATRKGTPPKIKKPSIAKMKRLHALRSKVPF